MTKMVFFVGSGASKYTGIPTFKDFQAKAKDILEHYKNEDYIKYAANIAMEDWIKRFDNLNVEEYYQILELENILKNEIDKIRQTFKPFNNPPGLIPKRVEISHLHMLILHVIVNSNLQAVQYSTLEPHRKLLKKIRDDNNILLTTNWDFIFEECSKNESIDLNYCTKYLKPFESDMQTLISEPTDNSKAIKLLKLHGSINWTTSSFCKMGYYFKNPLSTPYYENSPECPCKKCVASRQKKEVTNLEMLIIPPTWFKLTDNANVYSEYLRPDEVIRDIWNKALNYLKNIEQIFFIGYSLPDSDNLIRSLLVLSTRNKRPIITVIGPPDESYDKVEKENLMKRYKYIFPWIKDDENFKFYGFEKWIDAY